MMGFRGMWLVAAAGVMGGLVGTSASLGGTITGHARFERVAGKPSMGYVELYESDLFLSPQDNSFVGPSRRLGAPPGQNPTGDGFYSISNLPAGKYSILVNQPDFFIAPKVEHSIQLGANETKTVNINLDVDYSTNTSGQDWVPWTSSDWIQTFKANGTSVTGISFRCAGTTAGKPGIVTILKDNGKTDVRQWTVVATKTKPAGEMGSNTDNWVRFRSGEVPLTPGSQYAIKVHVDNGFAPYKRNKDSNSYAFGRAYDDKGQPYNWDLNYTVFVDKSDTQVTMNKRGLGVGELLNNFSTRAGQTFTAQGSSLASVDLFAAGGSTWNLPFTWTVREDGPNGKIVGVTKRTDAAYFTPQVGLHGVSYSPGEIPLIPGEQYYIEFTNPSGFNPHLLPTNDPYAGGTAYINGSAIGRDLSMTILEYRVVPEPGTGLMAGAALLFATRRKR